MIYHCYFCQTEMLRNFSLNYCPKCPHDVKMIISMSGDNAGRPQFFYFRVTYHKVEYDLTYYTWTKKFYLYQYNKDVTKTALIEIFHLMYLPNITPYNIMDKLPTLLTFS
jgi:hypothetical protein